MSQPAPSRRNVVVWVLVALAASVGLCCLGGAALLLLGADEGAGGAVAASAQATGSIPTGDTPELFPGSPGWLPSGRGVPIPDAEVDDSGLRGLWWYPQVRQDGMVAITELFLSDGTWATHPRPGGGLLFDLEGQRRQRGTVGVGTWSIDGDALTRAADGHRNTDPFRFGDDDEGPWFEAGASRRRPLAPPSRDQLPGTWKTAGSTYTLREDGTLDVGFVTHQVAGGHQGTWVLDGYLLQITPSGAPGWITTIGATGHGRFLVIGNALYSRE